MTFVVLDVAMGQVLRLDKVQLARYKSDLRNTIFPLTAYAGWLR